MNDLSQYSDADLAKAAGLSPPVVQAAPTVNSADPLAHLSDDDLKAAAGITGTAPVKQPYKSVNGSPEPSFETAVMAQVPFASDAAGLANAVAGAVSGSNKPSLTSTITGQPTGFGADYDQGRKDFWAANEQYKQDHPVLDRVAQVLGTIGTLGAGPIGNALEAGATGAADVLGLGSAGAGADAVASAAPAAVETAAPQVGSLLGRSIRSAAVAAPIGAVNAFGTSNNDLQGRLRDAAIGGTAGAVLGGVAPGVTDLASNVIGNLADKSGLSGSALGNFLGVATPEDKAVGLLAKALSREPSLAPSDIAANLAVNAEKPMTIADTGSVGGPIARLTRGILDRPGEGGATGAQFLSDRDLGTPVNGPYDMFRQGGAADRIVGDAKSAFGQGSAPATIDQLVAKGDADSAPLYDAFRAAPPTPASDVQPFMSSPTFQGALKRANTTALDRGEAPLTDLIDFNDAGDPVKISGGAFPPATLDRIKQGIDDSWLAAKASGDRGAASTANNLRTRFLNFMDQQYPDTYPQARAAFAGPAVSRDAIKEGMDVFNTAPEDVGSTLASLNPEDQNNFSLGVQRAIVNRVKNTPDGANEVAKIFGNPAKRESVGAVFTDPDALNQFSQNLGIENRMAQTKNLTAGSRTLPSAADQADLSEGLSDVGAHILGGNLPGAALRGAGMVFSGLRGGATEQTGSALARILLNTNPSTNAATIQALSQTPVGKSILAQALLSGSAAGQIGSSP